LYYSSVTSSGDDINNVIQSALVIAIKISVIIPTPAAVEALSYVFVSVDTCCLQFTVETAESILTKLGRYLLLSDPCISIDFEGQRLQHGHHFE